MQIVYSSRRGSRTIEHLGSAHDEEELEALKAVARQRLAAGQGELDLRLSVAAAASSGGPLQIASSRMGHLWDGLCRAYDALGFDRATGGDDVFRQLVLARIIEPTSKEDSLRVLTETGLGPPSYRTVKRRLAVYAEDSWRRGVGAACARHASLGPASLVLFDVSTLHFETDRADGFREPGFSKQRRLDPQITLGLLTDGSGFPLMVEAFEGNKAETKTMLPVIEAFMAAHRLSDVTVVADAGMVSAANQKAIEAAGLSFILGARLPEVPYVVSKRRAQHPDEQLPDGHVFTQPWPAAASDNRCDQVIYYQYKADRARRTLRGIDEQVAKAEKAVAGQAPVKRNRFIKLTGGAKSVNRELEAKTRGLAGLAGLAGLKGYVTNLVDASPEFVIGAYHQLWRTEKSFRMSKHDLRARPIYHHKRHSIDAHLTIVFAALAITQFIEDRTGWSIKKFVRTARRYRTVHIRAGQHILTAEDPLPADLRDTLAQITKLQMRTNLARVGTER
ncbi:MAG: IS1634 family transposase [Sporichthyaceae bacterium]|nr:IS1634 family transposase [Sporichthyaceae bacterium]